jgi:iron complex outermembrane receptor protein
MNIKNPMGFKLPLSAFLVGLSCSAAAQEIEEIIVRSSLIDATADQISNPLHIISGDFIAIDGTQSLGSRLDDLVGLSTSDYGAAVGQPIIRGMSGSRVKVLNNGVVVRDVSGLGPDHINEVDMNDIQQVEIIRGPSSLLYSNGTIGGIVNIVDNTIAREDILESEFKLGLEAQSVNDGDSHNLSYRNNIGGLNLSFAYKDAQFGNFEIPDGAVLHEEEDHEDHEEDHDEDHDDHEEHEEDLGYLANSDTASTSTRLGLSKAGDWGFFGLSYADTESVYGIPFHGEGHEGHGDHDDDEDHDDEDHAGEDHDDEDHEDHEGHEGERIFASTESKVLSLEGSYALGGSLVKKVDYFFRDTDYSLIEQHAEMEEEHEGEHEGEDEHDDHHDEGPTEFKNDTQEYGAIFDLGNDTLSQKLVVNFVEEDVSVVGAEAFINPTKSEEITLGYYISKDFDLFNLDFGVRYDQMSRSGSMTHREDHDDDHDEEHHDDHGEDHGEDEHDDDHEAEVEYFDKDINNTSFALSLGREINKSLDISLGFASVERAPTAVELLMNGPHLATGRLEVGNINLASERSNNIDLTLNYENQGFYATLTFFKNDVDNYIYLFDETEEEHEEHEEEEHHGGLILANYLQQDTEFDGYELEIGKIFSLARGELELSFAQDSVSAKFSDGTYVPRITPKRNLFKASYTEDDLKLALSFKDAKKQTDIADNETVTDGFQILNINLSKTIALGGRHNLTLAVFGKNLLDEVARNHSSFVKNEVPMAGRNLGLRATYSF